MYVDSEIINQFLTGTISIFVMVLIGGSLAYMFRSIGSRFTFTKAALIIGLPPFCFSLCLDRGGLSTIYLFGIVMILAGFLIDGTRHLLLARRDDEHATDRASRPENPESNGKQVIWEKVD